jgi:hypothetical protein
MTHDELVDLLHEKGFISGWALSGETLTHWDNDQDPPAPLTRPEATDETPSPD